MSLSIKNIEERIAMLEQQVAQSIANHNGLLGALAEAKNFLGVANTVVQAVAPNSEMAEVINAVDSAIKDV